MNFDYIAHVRKADGQPQFLQTHLTETAEIAKLLAAKLDLDQAGELLGLMHDFGKYSRKFQKYIHDETSLFNPDLDDEESTPNGSKVDHSTAGAQWAYRELRKFGAAQGIANCSGKCWVCALPHITAKA